VEWEGLERKIIHFRLNPFHSPPILFYPNKPLVEKSDLHITTVCWFSFLLAVVVPFPTMVHFCITKKLKIKDKV
jgi:hypothetical protein